MADPITTLATAVGFTVTTAKFLAQLHAVGGETGTVIDQIQIVMGDVIEAETLYQEQTPSLSEREQSRVQQIIKDTKKTLKQIATQVERARVSKVKHGTITLVHRLDWIFRKSGTAQSYQQILATCQRSLQGEIFKLRLKSLANGPRLPSYEEASSAKWIGNDTEFDEDLKDAINSFEHGKLINISRVTCKHGSSREISHLTPYRRATQFRFHG